MKILLLCSALFCGLAFCADDSRDAILQKAVDLLDVIQIEKDRGPADDPGTQRNVAKAKDAFNAFRKANNIEQDELAAYIKKQDEPAPAKTVVKPLPLPAGATLSVDQLPAKDRADILRQEGFLLIEKGDLAGAKKKFLAANELVPGLISDTSDEALQRLAQTFQQARDTRRRNDAANPPRRSRTGE